MYKRIIIVTHDGNKFTGDIFKVDETSPVIFGYPPNSTEQEFEELDKLRLRCAITIDEIERWWCEEVGSSNEKMKKNLKRMMEDLC